MSLAAYRTGRSVASPPAWGRFAFWLGLALVGQAAALQMISAGPFMRYQHYDLQGVVLGRHPVLLLAMLAQTALVGAGLARRWPVIREWVGASLKLWQVAGVAAVFILSSATVSRSTGAYVGELLFAAFVQVVNLGNVVLMVLAVPEGTLPSLRGRLERVFGRAAPAAPVKGGGLDLYVWMAAAWVAGLAAILSALSYQRHPHIPDEVVYLYHARFLAGGALTLPAPPVPEAFETYLMQFDGARWYPTVPPGWPAMLALGVLVGVPWLVNPLLAGVNVLLAYLFVGRWYDRSTARMVVLLLCVSPWHVFMAMNFMTHTFTLTCALAAAVLVERASAGGGSLWAWLGGFAVGLGTLIRPLDGLVVGGLLGLRAIGVGGRRLRATCLAAFVLGALVIGAVTLPYNRFLTGDPRVFPLMAYTEKHFGPNSNAYGFGPDRGMGWPIDPFPGHGPLDALVNANLNTFSINVELFGWSTGSLIVVALLLLSGRMTRADLLMVAAIAAVFVAYFFYYFSGGPDFGARYWFLMLIPLVVLTVRGVQVLERIWGSGATLAVVALCFLTLVNYFPWRAIDKYYHYLGMRPDIRRLADDRGFGKSLVLIRGDRFPDYASAVIYNPLDLYADAPVYAWDRSPEIRSRLVRAFPDRPIWVINGPSITKAGYRVVAGPVSARELVRHDDGAR